MINPYSFANSGKNSSFIGNSGFGVKPPATFGEYMRRLFQKFIGWMQRGWSVSKNIVWGASIASIFVLLPLVAAEMMVYQDQMGAMTRYAGA